MTLKNAPILREVHPVARQAERTRWQCFVTSNSFFVDGPPFDGMRKVLERVHCIYHVDLHGNAAASETQRHDTQRFGIQVKLASP